MSEVKPTNLQVVKQAALDRVRQRYGPHVTFEYLKQRSRNLDVVRPRQYFCAYVRAVQKLHPSDVMGLSYPVLGRFLNQHHSTVMFSVTKAHEDWGEYHFDSLALNDWPVPEEEFRFVNGSGWERAA